MPVSSFAGLPKRPFLLGFTPSLMLVGGMLSILPSWSWPLSFLEPWRIGFMIALLLIGGWCVYQHVKADFQTLVWQNVYVGFWIGLSIYTLTCFYFLGKSENVAALMGLSMVALAWLDWQMGRIWFVQSTIWCAFSVLLFRQEASTLAAWDMIIWVWIGGFGLGMTHFVGSLSHRLSQLNAWTTAMREASEDGVLFFNPNGDIKEANDSAYSILGYRPYDPAAIKAIESLFACISATHSLHQAGSTFYDVQQPDGTEVSCRISWRQIGAEGSNGWLVILSDLSYLKASHQEIKAEYEELRRMIDSSPDLIWAIDEDRCLLFANQAFIYLMKELTGVELKPGMLLSDLQAEASIDRHRWQSYYSRAFSGKTFTVEEENLNEAGKTQLTEIFFQPLLTGETVTGVTVWAKDQTEVFEQRNLLKGVMNASQHSIMVLEPIFDEWGDVVDLQISLASEGTWKLFSMAAPATRPTFLELMPSAEDNGLFLLLEEARLREACIDEEYCMGDEKDPKAQWIRTMAVPNGQQLVLIMEDFTIRKQAEIQLIKAKRAAEAGRKAKADFIATISHELRTPMNGV
ncbi:MAG: PAS domain-containing protein, partial [Bacteroidota bacterium]